MITITPRAASRLNALIQNEPDAEQLGIRIHVTTTGCSSYSFSIAITEQSKDEHMEIISGVKWFYREDEMQLLSGLCIELDPQTGRFAILHAHPPQACCPIR